MSIITIPKQLIQEKELVLIPKKEYEELLEWKKKSFQVVKPTKSDLRAIERGRREVVRGDYVTLGEFKKELGF